MIPNLRPDLLSRAQLVGRQQQLFGALPQLQMRSRPTPDERVDLPEIQESTRVSFSNGVRVQASQDSPRATSPGIAMYQQIAALARSAER